MIRSFLRGLALLRHPELVRDLGERRFHLQRIEELKQRFPGTKLSSDIVLAGFRSEHFRLDEAVTICAGTVLAFGDQINGFGSIRIGKNTWIGQHNNLRAGGGDVVIGADCLISQFCTLVASNHGLSTDQAIWTQSPAGKRGVTLADDVWLGAGVVVLPGVQVGQGAVIGAGSVVTRDIPPYEIWAGSPARMVGRRE